MGGYSGLLVLLVLLVLAVFLTTGRCDVSCRGTDGHAGEKGAPGRDGYPGAKGEKGEPAVVASGPVDPAILLRLKGEQGSRGPQGPMGPKGYQGLLGAAGRPGKAGVPGPDGENIGQRGRDPAQQARSAFSMIRTDNTFPTVGAKITFQSSSLNVPGDFSTVSSDFTCRVAGVYYFTFYSVAKVTLCLKIVSTSISDRPVFCDYHKAGNRVNDQVMTGGVVLQLAVGQKVWLESYKDAKQTINSRDTSEKQIGFSGFLLFADS
ncbi:complement C1q subcomponent subunit C-like [Centropristis striata]|uniref:complement C1q subcomponent subunit C-like n=1 Tax=Centropristis striata TaxID=184440 RepID=UPI0027E0147D|nr:complement C1q subcomponent subunit C-like [Centropristis striata]